MATYTENYSLIKPAGSDLVNIADLNKNTDKIDVLIHDTRMMLANPYDEEKEYQKYDIVLYENALYKCIAEQTEIGAFVTEQWEKLLISEVLTEYFKFKDYMEGVVLSLLNKPEEGTEGGEEI